MAARALCAPPCAHVYWLWRKVAPNCLAHVSCKQMCWICFAIIAEAEAFAQVGTSFVCTTGSSDADSMNTTLASVDELGTYAALPVSLVRVMPLMVPNFSGITSNDANLTFSAARRNAFKGVIVTLQLRLRWQPVICTPQWRQ
jgi:hypothetical protein